MNSYANNACDVIQGIPLAQDPRILTKARSVCTGGRIYNGSLNDGKPAADWNVRADAASWQAMVTAP